MLRQLTKLSITTSFRSYATSEYSNIQITGPPQTSLVDEKLQIKIKGLSPNLEHSVHLNVTNGLNLNYDSFTKFASDENGLIDFENTPPSCQSYSKQIDSMGIFRCLKHREGFSERIWSEDITKD